MDTFVCTKQPHRRYNLLTGEWILVSPQRAKRPWSGQLEKPVSPHIDAYQADCYLCPQNTRAGGAINPPYTTTFVFTNDFGALLPDAGPCANKKDRLLQSKPEQGICRVICYSPRHDLTLGRLPIKNIIDVIDTWIDEFTSLSSHKDIGYVQIFENRGSMMGCSNPHPHGQIWASACIPTLPEREGIEQKKFLSQSHSCLLCDYLEREESEKSRLLFRNDSFAVLVPFWAVWPFETLLIPRFHAPSIDAMDDKQKRDLAAIMIQLETAYDNLFKVSFPFSMGIHQQPSDGGKYPEWHWHIHYYPPLLRSHSIKKHMVGYELLAMVQRDITAEEAAERLRNLPRCHFMGETKLS
jgi:UDPglucose--hexose-1-phosphate uridylyltransferase